MRMYAVASPAEPMSGSETISSNGTPARLRSTPVSPGNRSCTDFPASSSRWARAMPILFVDPSSSSTSSDPRPTTGSSYWLI